MTRDNKGKKELEIIKKNLVLKIKWKEKDEGNETINNSSECIILLDFLAIYPRYSWVNLST